jgi:type III secretion system FlhB-like substrate exporter|tara:strand:- start:778 stop:1023 length:246 start_codon:yes stop_codon:yes gene_type:complete
MEGLETSSAAEAAVILNYDPEDPTEVKQIKPGRDQVGAALIRYCKGHKIPLPRLVQKILQVQNGEVSLMVSTHWKMKKTEG